MSLATWVYLSIFMVTGSVNRASGVPVGTPGFCGQFLNGFDEFPRPDLSDEATCCATLDRLQDATIEKDGKRITTRTAVAGQVGSVFQAAGIALPPNLHERAA